MQREVYAAESEEAADTALRAVEEQFNAQNTSIGQTFRDRWEQFVPFLSCPSEVRRMLYTTNVDESLNSQLRKVLRQRGPLLNDDAVFKLPFLAIRNAKVHGRRPVNWGTILTQLDIFFEGRLPA